MPYSLLWRGKGLVNKSLRPDSGIEMVLLNWSSSEVHLQTEISVKVLLLALGIIIRKIVHIMYSRDADPITHH